MVDEEHAVKVVHLVLDADGRFERCANPESILWQRIESDWWEARLKSLVAAHAVATDSRWAHSILDDWDRRLGEFWQVCPKEMLMRIPFPLSDEAQAVVGG